MRLRIVSFAACFLLACLAQASEVVSVQLIGINDFHGNLEAPSPNWGGVEYLSTHIQKLKAQNPNTVVVAAGDLIGASPLVSALFHDEPTIEAMDALGLDYSSVGNHEFDDGWSELLRLQPHFRYLSANVTRGDTGKTLFAPYVIRDFSGVKIAFVGAVLKGAPSIISPAGVLGLNFFDEAETINALVPELKAQGVQSIVVLIHEGGMPTGGYNECPGISGNIVNIANRLDDSVDVVISGHTHQAYNCVINHKLVTSAGSYGHYFTDVNLGYDGTTGKKLSASATNFIVTHDVAKDPAESVIVQKYKALSAQVANRVVGTITSDLKRSSNASGESKLGRVIVDAQLEAGDHADIAFLNSGGIRADLNYASSNDHEGDGKVTFSEIFSVQPFSNNLVTMTLSGDQIHALLEQEFAGCGQDGNRILQVSNGLSYAWKKTAPACNRVDPSSIKLKGVTLNPISPYRVTVNSFLADGGDGFTVFKSGTQRITGPADVTALESYLSAHSPLSPSSDPRIVIAPSN